MTTDSSPDDELGVCLSQARRAGRPVVVPPRLHPADAAAAFDVQHRTLAVNGWSIAAWKVGAKSADGPIQGAPLPSATVHRGPASARRAGQAVFGLELEIAFRFGRRFVPSAEPYSSGEVMAAVAGMAAAIEIVSTRLAGWPQVDKLLQLADLQNHGALYLGPETAYDADYPFATPEVHLAFDDRAVWHGPGSNPAGDPRRLLAWVVNHATGRGLTVGEDAWVTTGSYTGMYFPEAGGLFVGGFEGVPGVRLEVHGD